MTKTISIKPAATLPQPGIYTSRSQSIGKGADLCAAGAAATNCQSQPGRSRNAQLTFDKWRQRNISALETALGRLLKKLGRGQPAEISILLEAMGYSLLGGGKRLRPLLALAAAEAVGGRARAALPAAMAVEMVHCYSLIHDDLPAMDDDDLRRGRPTCHKVYGEGRAILAGDALLTLAFEVMFSGGDDSEALRRSQAAVHLARSAGILGMVGGQTLDLAFENLGRSQNPGQTALTISESMVRDMEIRKTGELISAALVCGGLLGGADQAQIKSLKKTGLSLGLAFQIQDDLLNRHGDVKILGKAVGSDQRKGKATFPQIAGEENAARALDQLTRTTLNQVTEFGRSGQNLRGLIESLVHRQS